MRAGPIDAPAAGATTKSGGGREHVRRRDIGHLLPCDILELSVTLAAARILQARGRPKAQPPEDFEQLILELIGVERVGLPGSTVALAMLNDAPRVEIPEDLRLKALKPLERMLDMSPPAKPAHRAAE